MGQGYGTMAYEADEQLLDYGCDMPTHIFIQAGVGSLAGAVTAGLLYTIMKNDEYAKLRKQLELDENSKVLLFSTEGDTDPLRYQSVVWDGQNSLVATQP